MIKSQRMLKNFSTGSWMRIFPGLDNTIASHAADTLSAKLPFFHIARRNSIKE